MARSGRCGFSSRTSAEQVFEDYVKEFGIPVHRDEWLDRAKGVKKDGARITAITTLSGKTYAGKMFIDATYEGDLMAAAGVDYHVGREAKSAYGEEWNGVQTGVLHHRHHFGVLKEKISPYVVPGDPKSGVLPRVSAEPPGEYGAGDKKVQAYCYPHVPHRRAGKPHPVSQARRLRPEAVRTAAARLRRRLARDVREVRSDPESQDRHEQPRAVQHRQHRDAITTTPRPSYETPAGDPQGARDVSKGLALLHRERSARAGGGAGEDAAVGPAEG